VSELLDVFVGAQYLPRRNYQIKKMVTFCKNREFTHIILINEFKHKMRMSCSASMIMTRVPATLSLARSRGVRLGNHHLLARWTYGSLSLVEHQSAQEDQGSCHV